MSNTSSSNTRHPSFRKKEDPRRLDTSTSPSPSSPSSSTNTGIVNTAAPDTMITLCPTRTASRQPRTPNRNNMPVSMPSRPPSNTQQPTGTVVEPVPKFKRGILRSFGKKVKSVFRRNPPSVSSSGSNDSSSSNEYFGAIVASGLQSASAVGIHHRPRAVKVTGAGGGDVVSTVMAYDQLLLPSMIPVRTSSLHAYSTNDGYGSESTIELVPWTGSPSSKDSPLVIEQLPASSSTSTSTSTSTSDSVVSSDAAVAGSTSPPVTFLETSTNMPRKTRTRTIARTTTDPVITIKLIHTPSPSDVSSPSRLSEMSSNSDSDLDSCEGMNDLRSVVEVQMNRRQEIFGVDGVDPFADFDSISPWLEAEDEQGGEGGEGEGEEDEREYYSSDRNRDDEKGDDNEPGSGSGAGSGAGVGHHSSPASDNNRYDNFRTLPSQDRSHNKAPPPANGASPRDAPADLTVPEIPTVHSYTPKDFSSTPTKKTNHHSKPNRKRESIAWLDHYLALNNTYRDNLATLHLHLFQSLHRILSAHTTTLLNLQQQILGIQGVGNGKLDNQYLIDLVSTKLSQRMERDLRNQTRFCIGVGELVQQGFGRALLTVDYEEEDEFEGVRVDPVVVAVKEKKKRMKEGKENGDEMKEEKVESVEKEEEELVKMVNRVCQRGLPVDEQWALFRWTELQRPYATLKDLNEARACIPSSLLKTCHQQEVKEDVEVQDGVMHDPAGHTGQDVAESTVEEKKEENPSDEEWGSSQAKDSILIRSVEELLHNQQQRSSQDQEGSSGDDDIDETQFEMLTPVPGKPPPGDLGARGYEHLYSYTSDDNTDDGSETSTPPAGAGPLTRSFYMQDPSHCRLESPVEPLAFSHRPLTPTPPPSSKPDITTSHPSPAADDSEATGLNSNTEWMRVVRALAATEAASSAPGTRLPIWVVYAPPISASSPSAVASTGTTAATATAPSYPTAVDCDEASPSSEKGSADYSHDSREGIRRHVSCRTQTRYPPPSTTSTSGARYTSSGRKRRLHGKHSRTLTQRSPTSAPATVVNNHFRGGTHYHYNGSSTTMSSHRPMSVLSRRSSSSSSSSLSGPSVFMTLTSDSYPSSSRCSTSSLASRQSSEEEREVSWQSPLRYDRNQGHHQSIFPLLHQSPCPSSSTVHDNDDDSEDLLIFSPPLTPLKKPLPPLPLYATTSSYYTFPPPVQPAHRPGHRQLCGTTPDPLPSIHYHRPIEPTVVIASGPPHPVHYASRASRVQVRVSKPAPPKSQVYQLGNPKWRLEDSLLVESDNSTDSIAENAPNDASITLAPSLSLQQESQQQQQLFQRVPTQCSILSLETFQTEAEINQRQRSPPYTFTFENCALPPSSSFCSSTAFFFSSDDADRETWNPTSTGPQAALLTTSSNPTAPTASLRNADQKREIGPGATEMLHVASTADSEKKKNRKRGSPPYRRNNTHMPRRYTTTEGSESSGSSSWNRRADIRETELVLEGKRVEAAYQNTSRCSP